MIAQLQISKVEDYLEFMEKNAESYVNNVSISLLSEELKDLCGKLAFVNNQMAIAKKELNHTKKTIFNSTNFRNLGYSPLVAREYVNSQCEQEQYHYDICERASRTIVHTIDALRTCISALKEEAKVVQYGGQA